MPQLPVTLLYDHQSVHEVVAYINDTLKSAAAAGGDAGEGEEGAAARGSDAGSDDEGQGGGSSTRRARGAELAPADDKPSDLFKVLRAPAAPRPLFLAAPGVANAQSAYFSFSQFLQARGLCCGMGGGGGGLGGRF